MKKISLFVLGEKFEISLEDEFFEFVKDDLANLQKSSTKDILELVLKKDKEIFEVKNEIEKIIKKIEEKK